MAIGGGAKAEPGSDGRRWLSGGFEHRFVVLESGSCAGNGYMVVKDKGECERGSGLVDDFPFSQNVANLDYRPPGCVIIATDIWSLNEHFTSTTQCLSTGTRCLCFDGPACTYTSGTQLNPSTCMCGTKVCNGNRNGLYCYGDYSRCSGNPIPVCSVVDGTSANSDNCACGTERVYCA